MRHDTYFWTTKNDILLLMFRPRKEKKEKKHISLEAKREKKVRRKRRSEKVIEIYV